jgi:hypothetical protein
MLSMASATATYLLGAFGARGARPRGGAARVSPARASTEPPAPSPAPAPSRDTLLGTQTRGREGSEGYAPGMVSSLVRAALAPALRLLRAPGRAATAARTRDAWHAMQRLLLVDLLAALCAAFPELRPVSTRHTDDAGAVPFQSLDGTLHGTVRTLRGGRVDWAVTAEMWSDAGGFGAMRLDAFLDDTCDAPFLMLHLNVLPDKILFFFDLPPRVDLKIEDAYLARCYLQPPPGCARSVAALAAECINDESLTPYISRDAAVRTFMASPAALLFTVRADEAGMARVRGIAEEMVAAWCALAAAPQAAPLPEERRKLLRARDAITRNFVKRDPDTQARRNAQRHIVDACLLTHARRTWRRCWVAPPRRCCVSCWRARTRA